MTAFFFLICLFMAVLGLCCCAGFSLVVASGDSSLDAGPGPLIVGASRYKAWVLGHRLRSCGMWVSSCGSRALEHRRNSSRSVARGIFPDQGLNLCLLHWPADSSPLSHQGSPYEVRLHTWPQELTWELCWGNLHRWGIPGFGSSSPKLDS